MRRQLLDLRRSRAPSRFTLTTMTAARQSSQTLSVTAPEWFVNGVRNRSARTLPADGVGSFCQNTSGSAAVYHSAPVPLNSIQSWWSASDKIKQASS